MASQTNPPELNYQRLTFTRFIAATLVVIYHGICLGQNVFPFSQKGFYNFFIHGNLAVIYFFYLSGIIMGFAYLKKNDNPKKYYISRFARIYPMYFFGIILTLLYPIYSNLIDWTFNTDHFPLKIALKNGLKETYFGFLKDFKGFMLNIFLVQTWFEEYRYSISSPNWSLSVEIFFYLISPFLYPFFKKANLKFLIISSFSLVLLTLIIYYFLHENLKSGVPLWYLNLFYLGICVVLFIEKKLKYDLPAVKTITFSLLCITLFSLILIINFYFLKTDLETAITPFIMAFVFWIISDNKNLRWLEKPFFILLGEISYCIYILHFQITIYAEKILNHVPISQTFKFYFTYALIILVSYLCFIFIEKPLRNKINSWI